MIARQSHGYIVNAERNRVEVVKRNNRRPETKFLDFIEMESVLGATSGYVDVMCESPLAIEFTKRVAEVLRAIGHKARFVFAT